MEQNRIRNLKIISENAQKAKQNQKIQYDKNVYERQRYDVGLKVWLKNYVTKTGLSRKFTVKWIGPFIIEKILDSVNYVVKRLSDGKMFTTHYNRMALFKEQNFIDQMKPSKPTESQQVQIKPLVSEEEFQANFEQCLIEMRLNQLNDVFENNHLNESSESEAEQVENFDDNFEDAFEIHGLNETLNLVQNEVVEQVEGERVEDVTRTRSGRVVGQTQKLVINSMKAKSYN